MKSFIKYFSAPGKLLITGEYLILEGAEGIAVPLKVGQDLSVTVSESDEPKLFWKAYNPDGIWFLGEFILPSLTIEKATDESFAKRLVEILRTVRELNPKFLLSGRYKVKTMLDFNPEFGFGSSSTLIANLSRWANIDAFELQKRTFKGSGYDVACGLTKSPIIYKLEQGKPVYRTVSFNKEFAGNIFFVYLGRKQRSMDAIKQFKAKAEFTPIDIDTITGISQKIDETQSLKEFEGLLTEHELILSRILKTPPIHRQLFPGYSDGIVKSLGAWGGDFVLVTSKDDPANFKKKMKQRGFSVVYNYDELIA